jgi:hypothetical protein
MHLWCQRTDAPLLALICVVLSVVAAAAPPLTTTN